MSEEETFYEWRFRWGTRPASHTIWTREEPTAQDIAEWSEDLLNVRVERRAVTMCVGPIEVVEAVA